MPGELIGSGRDCDVFAAGPGRVLRRDRAGRSTEFEAATMRHVAGHGYPVPAVFDAAGPDIVMQRLEGPTMLEHMASRPWAMRSQAATLARLVEDLARVPVPQHGLPVVDPAGDRLVHLDLHPDNVVLTDDGPVVIDWSNAAIGPVGLDAANTWLTLAAGSPPGSIVTRALATVGRRYFVRRFLASVDRPRAASQLGTALALRELDPNLRPDEVETMRAVVDDAT
jgi:aminoglycoside phosphotransferase (APT) family kinase protein